MKILLSERIERLTQWFHGQNDRPLLGFFLGPLYPLHRYRGSRIHLPDGYVEPQDVVVGDYLDDCDRLYELYEDAGGDLIWAAPPFWGLPWVEASLGCRVLADHRAGSTRTQPPPGFSDKPTVPEFSRDNPWVTKMLEFIPALQQHSNGRYPVAGTLMRGISDLLSALYGGQQFILRMYDDPDEVHSVVEQLTEYWINFGWCLLEEVPLFWGGTGSFFYSVWCPGQTIWMQEDAAALLSPELFEEFIYPSVCRIADAFENTVMHLHPSQFVPLDYLMDTNIDVIELEIDKDGPTIEETVQYYQRVLPHKPLIIGPGEMSEAQLNFVLDQLPHKGLAINIDVDSPETAHNRWEQFMDMLG